MKDDRLPKIVLFCHLSGAKGKTGHSRMGKGHKKGFKGDVKLMEGGKTKALNSLDGVGACEAMLASGSLVLQLGVSSSSSSLVAFLRKKLL